MTEAILFCGRRRAKVLNSGTPILLNFVRGRRAIPVISPPIFVGVGALLGEGRSGCDESPSHAD